MVASLIESRKCHCSDLPVVNMRLLDKAYCKGGVRDSLVILSSIVKACIAPKVCDSSGKLPTSGSGLMKKEMKKEMKKKMKKEMKKKVTYKVCTTARCNGARSR